MRILYLLIPLQAALVAVLWLGDIGFDKLGKYGLDIEAGIVLLVIYLAALAAGLAFAIKFRRFLLFGVQLLPALFVGVYHLLPDPRFDASRHQYLVGKSKMELIQVLGSPRGALTGLHAGEGQPVEEFIDLRGMTIFISSTGTVLRVEPNDR